MDMDLSSRTNNKEIEMRVSSCKLVEILFFAANGHCVSLDKADV